MSDAIHANCLSGVINLVNDTIVTYANSPIAISAA